MGSGWIKRLVSDLRNGRPVSALGVRERDFKFPETWEERTRLVCACPDNAAIPRVDGAGQISDGVQVMHNGLVVRVDGYYGSDVTRMLEVNRGVHEPQEERVFGEVLRHVRPGGLIVELGAYWGFYSTWFVNAVPEGRAILVEPDRANLEIGRENMRLNELEERADFIQGFAGGMTERSRPAGASAITVDGLVESRGIGSLDLLHADVQGSEAEMLDGAARSLSGGLVQWVFISTHSMRVHAHCRRRLERFGYVKVAEADLPESYSYDGLLVFKHPRGPGPERVRISQRPYPGG